MARARSRTHILSFTYAPKIEKVQSGACTQTIRKVRKCEIEEGDTLILHGWKGTPYRSKWSWRMRVTVRQVLDCKIEERGVWLGGSLHPWCSQFCAELARLDGIEPPSGEELKNVLKNLNAPDWEGAYRIIRWEVIRSE